MTAFAFSGYGDCANRPGCGTVTRAWHDRPGALPASAGCLSTAPAAYQGGETTVSMPSRLLPGLLLGLLLPLSSLAQDTVTLLNWDGFLSERTVKLLKNRDGLLIEQITFTGPEEREALLKEHAGRIDLVVADTLGLAGFRSEGLTEPLDLKRIPNVRHLLTRLQAGNHDGLPYLWGHTGIAWRTDLLPEGVRNYAELFNLAARQPGKVALLDDNHEALRAALYAKGKVPYDLHTPEQARRAGELLAPHAAKLRRIGSILDETNPLLTGEVIAAQVYNGDIAWLRDEYKAALAFAVPQPGCMIWQEHFALLRKAPHRDAAYRFLNAINDPQIAARNAADVRYATANAMAAQNLPPDFRNDPIIRPTFDDTEDCYIYEPLDEATRAVIEAGTGASP